MSKFKRESFRIGVGDLVEGKKGKHIIRGRVMESKNKRGKPAVFSRWGFVGVWVETEEGNKTVINEVKPI